MTTDTITFKKELLLAQIENFTNSGYFTEKEIDRLCAPVKLELEFLECCEVHNSLNSNTQKTVGSFEGFKEAFLKLVKFNKQYVANIEVINPEILTQNNQEA